MYMPFEQLIPPTFRGRLAAPLETRVAAPARRQRHLMAQEANFMSMNNL